MQDTKDHVPCAAPPFIAFPFHPIWKVGFPRVSTSGEESRTFWKVPSAIFKRDIDK